MNFIKGIYGFMKNLIAGLYKHTIGEVVTLAKNIAKGKSDRTDFKGACRVIQIVLLVGVTVFLPSSVILLSITRGLVAVDLVGAVASTFFDLADLYAVEPSVAVAV